MNIKNNKYEVYTPNGFRDFDGIRLLNKSELLHIMFGNGNHIRVTTNHLFVSEEQTVEADCLRIGDTIDSESGKQVITNINPIQQNTKVYDLLEVGGGHLYYTNGIVSHNCQFYGSSSTLVDGAKIKSLPILRPIKQEYENKFNIYELPNKDHRYILICDVCEGVGKDYSVIQVIDYSGETYKQVAVFRDNTIKPFSFHLIIDKIGRYHNEALVMIERNSCGAEVANNLMYDLDYPNMYYGDDLGIRTTKKTKSLGCSNLAFLIETDKLLLCDYETINELSKFVYDGKTFKAQDYDDHDDLIMPLVLFAWLAMDKIEADLWLESTYVDEINKEKQEEVDEFLVLMDYSDC